MHVPTQQYMQLVLIYIHSLCSRSYKDVNEDILRSTIPKLQLKFQLNKFPGNNIHCIIAKYGLQTTSFSPANEVIQQPQNSTIYIN